MDTVGSLGLSSPTVKRIHGPDATFGDLLRADSRLSSLIDWLPTYATGVAEIFHKNPFPGARKFGALDVEGITDTNPGFVRFRYDWGMPNEGWAAPEIISAAQRRTTGTKERRRRTGGSSHRRHKPFSGWVAWQDERHVYKMTATKTSYVVLRQPAKQATA